jgi:hypothetical protein
MSRVMEGPHRDWTPAWVSRLPRRCRNLALDLRGEVGRPLLDVMRLGRVLGDLVQRFVIGFYSLSYTRAGITFSSHATNRHRRVT